MTDEGTKAQQSQSQSKEPIELLTLEEAAFLQATGLRIE